MKFEPFVSVVIPTYNRKEMLKDCLESLFNQNYPKGEYEIIVVDDGSTDGTNEVIQSLSEKHKLKYFYQENKGPAAARNLGIENSEGEIICFIDDDCIADRDWIKNLIKGYTDDKIGGVGGRTIGYNPKNVIEKFQDYLFIPKVIDNSYLPSINTANASYRRSILIEVSGFDPRFRTNEDYDLGIRVRKGGYRLRYMPSAIVYHKHREDFFGLLKREFYLAKGIKLICDKYPDDFSHIVPISVSLYKIFHDIITYPIVLLTIPFKRDKTLLLIKPFLNVIIRLSRLLGYITLFFVPKKQNGNDNNSKNSQRRR